MREREKGREREREKISEKSSIRWEKSSTKSQKQSSLHLLLVVFLGLSFFFSFFFSLCWITSVLSNPLWPITSRAFARKENVFKIPHRLEERMIVIFFGKAGSWGPLFRCSIKLLLLCSQLRIIIFRGGNRQGDNRLATIFFWHCL